MPLDSPEQLAVGVELIVVAGGVGLRRAESLGEPDEHDADAGPGGGEEVVEADALRHPNDGRPESMGPTMATPC